MIALVPALAIALAVPARAGAQADADANRAATQAPARHAPQAASRVQGAASASVPATPPAPAADGPAREPLAAWHIAEDEHVRVQELRVRGESRHITVHPKLPGTRPYEIAPASGALDPSQRGRRAPGTSQWRLLDF
jgi:hypothetical protein